MIASNKEMPPNVSGSVESMSQCHFRALFKHLLTELAAEGKMILYISHVLEVVEKVCAHVVIIYKK